MENLSHPNFEEEWASMGIGNELFKTFYNYYSNQVQPNVEILHVRQ